MEDFFKFCGLLRISVQVISFGQNIEAHDVQPPPATKTHPKDAIVSKDPVPAAKGKPTNHKNHIRQLNK